MWPTYLFRFSDFLPSHILPSSFTLCTYRLNFSSDFHDTFNNVIKYHHILNEIWSLATCSTYLFRFSDFFGCSASSFTLCTYFLHFASDFHDTSHHGKLHIIYSMILKFSHVTPYLFRFSDFHYFFASPSTYFKPSVPICSISHLIFMKFHIVVKLSIIISCINLEFTYATHIFFPFQWFTLFFAPRQVVLTLRTVPISSIFTPWQTEGYCNHNVCPSVCY